jgi:N-acyl-D-amino-acid deacylase
VFATVAWADDVPHPAVRVAIQKGLKRIEAGVTSYPQHRRCFSCHHQAMAVFSLTTARQRGFEVDDQLLRNVIDFSLRSFRNTATIAKGQGVGGDSTSVVYALHTFAAVERPYDDTTAALVRYLLARQRNDGSWPVPADRPPTMGSLFTNTSLALMALDKYSPPDDALDAADLQARIDAGFAKGRDWLLANQPASTEDKVFHLHGLVYSGVDAKIVAAARHRLLLDQWSDGSWGQLSNMSGDAYATATALVALRHAGLDVRHEGYEKGVKYLLDSQRDDGAWIVKTRSRPIQVFFNNGDPGGKSQFISFAATGWAVLALLETVPPAPAVAANVRLGIAAPPVSTSPRSP